MVALAPRSHAVTVAAMAPPVAAAARRCSAPPAWRLGAQLKGTPVPPLRQGGSSRGAGRRARLGPTTAILKGLSSVFSTDPSEKTRKKYQDRVDQVNALEPAMEQLSNEQLRAYTPALRARLAGGETLDSLLVEAFAVRGWVWV